MGNVERFHTNLQLWLQLSPHLKEKSFQFKDPHVAITKNSSGDLNLIQHTNAGEEFFHSNTNPLQESQQWFNSLDLQNANVIYVYGIGLGYAYKAAKDWLRKHELHTLVFLEDNLEVIAKFFETELATEFLNDSQVWLEYIGLDQKIDSTLMDVTRPYCFQSHIVSALPAYAKWYPEKLTKIHSKIALWSSLNNSTQSEFIQYGKIFFDNYYHNLFVLPTAYRGNELFGKFSNVPAIICGAGPSLSKNLAVLEKLSDRALIFAGSTALNAVNANGFIPHFGVGIDPNPTQTTRLIANKAFQIPFLFRNRMHHKTVKTIQGDLIHITGSAGYAISDWFEKKLNIEGDSVDEGCNVVNFSFALACAMGCNPIILVGLDLAFSENKSYFSGVTSHPTHSFKTDFTTKSPGDELLTSTDIHGQPVLTQWKWVAESSWYSQFSHLLPNVLVINATEGGIGMPGIPNKPLSEVFQYLLQRQFDLQIRVHGEIQNGTMPSTVTSEKIIQLLQALQASFQQCHKICHSLQAELTYRRFIIDQGDPVLIKHEKEKGAMTQVSKDLWEELTKEIAYKYVLSSFNDSHMRLSSHDIKHLDVLSLQGTQKNETKKMDLQIRRYEFLQRAALVSTEIIKNILDENSKEGFKTYRSLKKIPKSCYASNDHYSYGNDTFTIVDSELNVSFVETYSSQPFANGSGRDLLLYPNGSVKMEQFYLNNLLHGPATFFNKFGEILARNWYVRGKKEGKALFYYLSGELHSVLRYKDGELSGLQEYFFLNGNIKTLLNYDKGFLNGQVLLYHANGKVKRELYFINGLRQGIERLWNEQGMLLMEVHYQQDKSVGSAKIWYDDGQLAQEIKYDAHSKPISVEKWDRNGLLLAEDETLKFDFFDKIAMQANLFTESLEHVYEELNKFAPMLQLIANIKDDQLGPMHDEFEKLKTELNALHGISKELMFESGIENNPSEAIWKSPSVQREVEKKLEEMTEKLQKDLKSIQDIVGKKPPPSENQQEPKKQ